MEQLTFDGATYDEEQDQARLTGQMEKVWNIVKDGRWHTLRELAEATGGSEAGVSARLRDLRKWRYGSHVVDRRRVEGGLWEYRLGARPTENVVGSL